MSGRGPPAEPANTSPALEKPSEPLSASTVWGTESIKLGPEPAGDQEH